MKFSKLVLPGLAMIAVTYGLARFSFGLFLPDITRSLEITSAEAGVVSSLFYISYCITIIHSTFHSIKAGPRKMVTAAGMSALTGLLLIGVAPNIWILSIGVLFAGGSTGWISPPFGLAISLWINARQQGKANTWINSGTSLGIVFAGLSTMFLPVDWRVIYLIYASLAVIVIIWNYTVLPKYGKNMNIYAGSFNFRDIKGSETLALSSTILGVATAPFWTFSKSFVESLDIYTDTGLSLFWMTIGIFGIAGGISGMVIEKRGLNFAYKTSVIMISLASVILSLSDAAWGISFVSSALFGMSYIFLTGVLLVWGITIFIENASLGIGLPFLILALGQVFGSMLSGLAVDFAGYGITFFIFGAAGFLALVFSPKDDPVIRTPRGYEF